MRRGWTLAIIALALLVTLSGCKKKKPVLPPPQAQAPDIRRIPQPQAPEPLPPPTSAGKSSPAKPASKAQPKKKVAKKTTPKPEKKSKVVRNGGANEVGGQLSAGLTSSESTSQRRNTAQLLEGADSNLRNLRRALSSDEQSMVQQIRTYMAQSRTADADGDTERAYNLALKAHLLSQELIKR